MRTIDEYIKEKYREKIVDTTDMDKQTGILLPNQILVKTQRILPMQSNRFLGQHCWKGLSIFFKWKVIPTSYTKSILEWYILILWCHKFKNEIIESGYCHTQKIFKMQVLRI